MSTLSTVNRLRVAPRASVLIESLRDVGYTLESALADIVDNAITADATTIGILADTSGPSPRIAILDDGHGMDADGLLAAMRLGNLSPLDDRREGDLGRFGLGLKTASFSQCRRLTVVTRRSGVTAAARWDLDAVEAADDWLVDLPEAADVPWVDRLGESGTLVLWEKLDRLVGGADHDADHRSMTRHLDEAVSHLELVFHRFLAGERGLRRVAMSINGRPLEPYDPFHSGHPATIKDPEETIRVGHQNIRFQTYTLPHHKKVTPAEWERYAGSAGYVRNQGFYVYRGGRLIIHGTWFGLMRQTELTKLARVRIDIPTGLDTAWKIDIKKASAQLPPRVRERLRGLIETIGGTSKRVYTGRGRRLVSDHRLPVWLRVQDKNEIRYSVNPEHPVVTALLAGLPEDAQGRLRQLLELVGASLPVDALFADTGSQPAQVSGGAMSTEALRHAVETTFHHLAMSGIEPADIAGILQATEPFRSQWETASAFLPTASAEEDVP